MKKDQLSQIKGLSITELKKGVKSAKLEIANLIMDKNMKKLKDLKMISKKRKELAKVLTILKQKEILKDLESTV